MRKNHIISIDYIICDKKTILWVTTILQIIKKNHITDSNFIIDYRGRLKFLKKLNFIFLYKYEVVVIICITKIFFFRKNK